MTPDRPLPAIDAWRAIEREAREQVRAELDIADATPFHFGQLVAWVECMYGRTDALSVTHRASEMASEPPTTLCGEVIPAPIRRVTLSPNLVRALGRCRYCESIYAKEGVAA